MRCKLTFSDELVSSTFAIEGEKYFFFTTGLSVALLGIITKN